MNGPKRVRSKSIISATHQFSWLYRRSCSDSNQEHVPRHPAQSTRYTVTLEMSLGLQQEYVLWNAVSVPDAAVFTVVEILSFKSMSQPLPCGYVTSAPALRGGGIRMHGLPSYRPVPSAIYFIRSHFAIHQFKDFLSTFPRQMFTGSETCPAHCDCKSTSGNNTT